MPATSGIATCVGHGRRLVLLTAVCTASFIACEKPEPPEAARPVTIVFKHSKLFGDPGPFDALIAWFEEANPALHVKRETLPSGSDEQHQFYAINLQARSSDFDVYAVDVIWVAEFARAGWLRPLDRLLPPEAREAFFDGPVEAVTYQGRVYAVPWFIDAGLLYYRKDLLEKHGYAPPKTWQALVHSAKAIRAQEPVRHGYVWQGKQYEGLVTNALEYIWSNGGAVFHDARIVLDSAANVEALGFMRDLISKYRVTPGFVTTLTEETSRQIFGRGNAVYLRNWPYAWQLFQQRGSAVKGKVGMTLLPHFPGHNSAATLGGWQLGVNSFSKHPQAAQRLVSFMTSPQAQKALALAYGFNPPRKALYRDPELLAAQPNLAQLCDVFERARPRPVTPYYVTVSQVLQTAFSGIIAGIEPPREALAAARKQIQVIRP